MSSSKDAASGQREPLPAPKKNEPSWPQPSALQKEEIEERAAHILQAHGLYVIPVDVVTLANREGIKVHNAKFSEEGLSGILHRSGTTVTALVNQSDPPFRKRFTIAHELAHHFLHLLKDGEIVDKEVDTMFRGDVPTSGLASPRKLMEVQANQFAAALLMPAALVRMAFQETENLSALARMFNVSEEAMAIRLGTLSLA